MSYNSQDFANNSNQQYILDYTGTVKYYYYDSSNNKQTLYFQCQNASFNINSVGFITWQKGDFLSGDWINGKWNNATTDDDGLTWTDSTDIVSNWYNGNWYNGTWVNGNWWYGKFYKGNWYSGYWLDGIFGYENIISDNCTATWKNGYFFKGIFAGTQWNNGHFDNTNNDAYWMQKDITIDIWQYGYINDVYSNSPPQQILKNNNTLENYTGSVNYVMFENDKYYIKQIVCTKNCTINIQYNGTVVISSGTFKDNNFYNVTINNSTCTGGSFQNCSINNCTIDSSTFTNNNIVDCNISLSIMYNQQLNNSILDHITWYDGVFYSGTIKSSTWYDGIFNYNNNNICKWISNCTWYNGTWYGGYIDQQWSDTAPYIYGNGNNYNYFTGKISYQYNNTTYVIQLKQCDISIETDGQLLINNGFVLSGTFAFGNFINAVWNNGQFLSGTFENSTWNDGNFNGGTFYTSIWNNGDFYGGTFENSTWNDGNFYGGTFENSTWNDGNFYGGNWITLNSFWINGNWINGKQNGIVPSNYHTQTYVTYIRDQDLDNNLYIIDLLNYNIQISLYDAYGQKINLSKINSFDECQNYGYIVSDNILTICFKYPIDQYFKLEYSYILTDAAPKINLISNYEQYLSDINHLITGQFAYTVTDQNNQVSYYGISVKNANFSVDNGYITWNNGTFVDGYWYNGQWNENNELLNQFLKIADSDILYQIRYCIWQNGTWMNGNWNYENSCWKNGNWLKGTVNNAQSTDAPNFQLGNGKNYTNYLGQLRYIYKDQESNQNILVKLDLIDADLSISQDGYIFFNKGIFVNGYWRNGDWYGDEWYNGTWYNGTWHCGLWYNGTWYNGTWQLNEKYNKDQESQLYDYDNPTVLQGGYRTIKTTSVLQNNIPIIGFIIQEQQEPNPSYSSDDMQCTICGSSCSTCSNSSCSKRNYIFDEKTSSEYNNIYDNSYDGSDSSNSSNSSISSDSSNSSNSSISSDSSNSSNSSISSDSSSSNLVKISIKQWVNSKWTTGFIKNVHSNYAPYCQIANGNSYHNVIKTDQLVYFAPKYLNNVYLYQQFYLLNVSDATFSVSEKGFITWNSGTITPNSYWYDGIWYGGLFVNSVWHNGTWWAGTFASGQWDNGTWHDGHLTTANFEWKDGTWIEGMIDNAYSTYSPNIPTANNHIFFNYTGKLKYKNGIKFYLIDVSNAYFYVSKNGQIVFYKGTWNDGTFIGTWKTAEFNSKQYNYLLNNPSSYISNDQQTKTNSYINNGKNILYSIYTTTDDCKYIIVSYGKSVTATLFTTSTAYLSVWENGTFKSGTWQNGNWKQGQWLTDDNNEPIGVWIKGITNGGVQQTEPPTYSILYDTQDNNYFQCFTGKIKYQVNYFNIQTYSVTTTWYTISCTNSTFNIHYINKQNNNQSYRQPLIDWQDGTFETGTWYFGFWHHGTWNNGTWLNGRWLDGNWLSGTWCSGVWYNGFWKEGQQKQITILNMIKPAT